MHRAGDPDTLLDASNDRTDVRDVRWTGSGDCTSEEVREKRCNVLTSSRNLFGALVSDVDIFGFHWSMWLVDSVWTEMRVPSGSTASLSEEARSSDRSNEEVAWPLQLDVVAFAATLH